MLFYHFEIPFSVISWMYGNKKALSRMLFRCRRDSHFSIIFELCKRIN
jgi:hypothetical protein